MKINRAYSLIDTFRIDQLNPGDVFHYLDDTMELYILTNKTYADTKVGNPAPGASGDLQIVNLSTGKVSYITYYQSVKIVRGAFVEDGEATYSIQTNGGIKF